MTSPLARVPKAHQVWAAIVFLMNLTLPSAISVLTPPGWRLVVHQAKFAEEVFGFLAKTTRFRVQI